MDRTRDHDRHLRQRGGRWHYYRRVPKRFERFDDRGTIRLALGTSSLETARIRRDELAEADDAFWAGMALAAAAEHGEGNARRALARRRYEAAMAAAMACGFRYRPVEQLTGEQHLEDVVRRLVALNGRGSAIVDEQPEQVEALLGGVEELKVTVRGAGFPRRLGSWPHLGPRGADRTAG